MKKIILILALIVAMNMETKAQSEKQFTGTTYLTSVKPATLLYSPGKNGPDKDYNYYMHKSKSQRTVGWVTLGSGVLLSGIGLLVAGNGGTSTNNYGDIIDDNSVTAAALILVGGVSGIVSIPFMIMASANRHKARLMLSSQKTGFGVPSNVNRNITGITMTIPIGK